MSDQVTNYIEFAKHIIALYIAVMIGVAMFISAVAFASWLWKKFKFFGID